MKAQENKKYYDVINNIRVEARTDAIKYRDQSEVKPIQDYKPLKIDWPLCNPGCEDLGRCEFCTCTPAKESIARQKSEVKPSTKQAPVAWRRYAGIVCGSACFNYRESKPVQDDGFEWHALYYHAPPREPVGWFVLRDNDPTFPRFFTCEKRADELVNALR